MAKVKETKQEKLKKALEKFIESEKSSKDYIDLFVEFHYSIRPDNGLIWSQVEEILKDTVDKK
jgi:hypothetical protein